MTETKGKGKEFDLARLVIELREAIDTLQDNDDRILENQAEILEKLSNLSLPGGDYSIDSE